MGIYSIALLLKIFWVKICKAILAISSLRRSHNSRGFSIYKNASAVRNCRSLAFIWCCYRISMYCSTSLFVKGYYKAQPLNVSLVVFPRAHELFNFAAQPPALVFQQYLYRILYRSRASSIHIFLVQSIILCVRYTKIRFLFVALTDIFTENAWNKLRNLL